MGKDDVNEQLVHLLEETFKSLNTGMCNLTDSIDQLNVEVQTLNHKFSNGFRQELKGEIQTVGAKVEQLLSPYFWLKLFVGALGVAGTLVAILAVIGLI